MATRIIRLQKKAENGEIEIVQGIYCPKEAGKNNPIQLGEFGCIIPLVNSPQDMQMTYVYAHETQRKSRYFFEVKVYNSIDQHNLHDEETEIMLIVDKLNEEKLKIYEAKSEHFVISNWSSGGIFYISHNDIIFLEDSNMRKVYKAQKIENQMYLIELYQDACIFI